MIEPFLKWPGGKRWLASRHRSLFPKTYARYFEPFLGGGAVFFSLAPHRALLSDTNRELTNTYRCIKEEWSTIERRLAKLQAQHSPELYYQIRDRQPSDPVERAVRFVYLNRTCFNGIYRVNREGMFNVPIGTKDAVSFSKGYLEQVADTLRTTVITDDDFERSIGKAGKKDFVFVDPPYTVMHNNNGFVKYNAKLFSWPDQARLAKAIMAASRRGAMVMISNADHPTVRALYDGFGTHRSLTRHSILAGDSCFRRSATELLITNYCAEDHGC